MVGKPFEKGRSGNPSGRPKAMRELSELARNHTGEAIDRLVTWMRSKNAKASVAAANALLDRGWGKPAQFSTGDADQFRSAIDMSDDELAAIAAGRGDRTSASPNGKEIVH